MARGLQKLQSQQKTNEKKAATKSAHDNKKTAQAGLLFQCIVCKVRRDLFCKIKFKSYDTLIELF